MRYPPAETAKKHERILEKATRLFGDRGFEGVSIPEIMKSAGLTHGSFYNHFESKTKLIEDCILHGATKSLAGIDDTEPTAAGKDTYIEDYLSVAHRDDAGSGCLISALGSEVSREPDAHAAMTLFIKNFIERLSSHFPWPTKGRSRSDAIRLTAALVGGLVLARAVDDDALSHEILREVSKGLRRSA